MGCEVTACREIMVIEGYSVQGAWGNLYFTCRWPRIKGGGRKEVIKVIVGKRDLIGSGSGAFDVRL